MKSLFAFVLTISLSGCVSFPNEYAPVPPDITIGPPPADAEAAVRAHMETVLRDPESARYKFEAVHKAYAHEPLTSGGKFAWAGHRIDFAVNAKNGYGGYTGFQHYIALFSNGRITRTYEAGTSPWVWTFIPD